MKNKFLTTAAIIYMAMLPAAYAQEEEQSSSGFGMVENRGQVLDVDNIVSEEAVYYSREGHDYFYFTQNKTIAYSRFLNDDSANTYTVNRIDLNFTGINPSCTYVTGDNMRTQNYYLGKLPAPVDNVPVFNNITMDNLYSDIDLTLSTAPNLEMLFVIDPHADPSLIEFTLTGAEASDVTAGGGFRFETLLGNFEYDVLEAWQQNGSTIAPVQATLLNTGSSFQMQVGNYNSNDKLFITIIKTQPWPPVSTIAQLVRWATYIEGTDIFTNDVYLTNADVILAAGHASADPGAFVGTVTNYYQGAGSILPDAFVAKFNQNRELEIFTYIGGSQLDRFIQVAVDGNGYVIAGGVTRSDNVPVGVVSNVFPIPVASGCAYFDEDGLLARLDADLQVDPILIPNSFVSYFGGGGYDAILGLAISSNNDIYFCGVTGLAVNPPLMAFPTQPSLLYPNAYFQNPNSVGVSDGFLAQIRGNSLVWNTVIGGNSTNGSAMEVMAGVALTPGQNPVVYGHTHNMGQLYTTPFTGTNTTGTIPIVGIGAATSELNSGETDAYLAEFEAGIMVWSTCHGGSLHENNYNNYLGENHNIAITPDNTIYIGGFTETPPQHPPGISFPIVNSGSALGHNVGMYGGGGSDGFLARFSPARQLTWSTYLGGVGLDEVRAVNANVTGRLYVLSITRSNNFLLKNQLGSYYRPIYNGTGTPNPANDAAVSMFGIPSGRAYYSSYFGSTLSPTGFNNNQPYSLAAGTVNSAGVWRNKMVLVGTATDNDNYPFKRYDNLPATNDYYYPFAFVVGGYNGFIAELEDAGCQCELKLADESSSNAVLTACYTGNVLHYKSTLDGVSAVTVFTAEGRSVYSEWSKASEGDVLLPPLTAGVYILTLQYEHTVQSVKFVVQQ